VYVDGNLTLTGGGTATNPIVLNEIRYLHVNGNLTISSYISMPNLVAVYVSENLIFQSNSGLIGNGRRHGDEHALKGQIIGSNFVVGGNMTVNMSNDIRHNRFYVPNSIDIRTSSNGQGLYGNSVYIAYNRVYDEYGVFVDGGKINIGMNREDNNIEIGSNRLAPQFYAGHQINARFQGNGAERYGLFGAYRSLNRYGNSNNPAFGYWLVGDGSTSKVGVTGLPTNTDIIPDLLDYGMMFRDATQREVTSIGEVSFSFEIDTNSNLNTGIREVNR
jgi:hypothetical protein